MNRATTRAKLAILRLNMQINNPLLKMATKNYGIGNQW